MLHAEYYCKMQNFLSSDKTCFERFFQHEDIVGLLDRFVIYHVDAPGQVTPSHYSEVPLRNILEHPV